jgi:glycosyltransferase involved in cell wall biosynthesis
MSDRHPDARMPPARELERARRAAEDLGVAGRHVIFNEGWVEYERRADWLLDADVGVSLHHYSIEAHLSFRTRILDYLWAGLPVLFSAGDALADELEFRGAGMPVTSGDVDATATAIALLADDAELRVDCARRGREYIADLTWERAAAPLVKWCAAPRQAPDLAAGGPLRPACDRPLSRRWLAARARRWRGGGR